MTLAIESNLHHGWVPDGASVLVLARLDDAGIWESLVPEFSIAGRGDSADEALINALELLDDYLLLCAREGQSFEQAQRGLSRGMRFAVIRELASLVLGSRLHRGARPRRDREYRIPLNVVGIH